MEPLPVTDGPPTRNAAFRLLWIGTGLSALGSFVGGLALAFLAVRRLDAGPRDLAALATFQIVAGLVAAPFAGVLVDRFRRRPLLIAADITRALVLASLPVIDRAGWLSFGALWFVGAVNAAASVLFNSAYQAYTVRLVGRSQIVRANSLVSATVSGAEILGFAVAGWVVEWLGEVNTQWVDATSFVASALCLASIRRPGVDTAPQRGRPLVAGRPSLVGPRVVWRNPVLRSVVATNALFDTAVTMTGVSYLLYLTGDLGYRPGTLGTIFAIGGITSLIGARIADRAEHHHRLGRVLAVSGFVRTAGMAFMPGAFDTSRTSTALLVGNQVVTDPAWMLHGIAETSIRQAHTPDEVAGRVASTRHFFGSIGRLVGAGLAAIIGQQFGPRAVLWTAVGICFMASFGLATSAAARLSAAGG